jgi:DNA-binding transcriptional regulator YbjK
VSNREVLLLDAAIDVLAEQGIRQLTHRAVDARANLAIGSTSNRFRTRDVLLAGVLRRLLEREATLWTRMSAGMNTGSIDGFAGRLGQLVQALAGPERALTLARQAVFGQAVVEPALRGEVREARHKLIEWLGPPLVDLGSEDVSSDLRHLLALIDGLLGAQLLDPAPDFDPAPPVAALLHGLIEQRRS